MNPPFIAIGFGLVVIASAFLTAVFYRAWRYPLIVVDDRFKVVIIALMVGTAGSAFGRSIRLYRHSAAGR